MENYFNYFTEIEEHFQRRFGGALLLSTVDWALIEVWKDAGVPLAAVLRGIDATFEHFERKKSKARKVNGLGFCAQEVLLAADEMKEAAVGVAPEVSKPERGFQSPEIVAFLRKNAGTLESIILPETSGISVGPLAGEVAKTLRQLAVEVETKPTIRLEDLERHLTVLEEKLAAALVTVVPDAEMVAVRAQADREMTAYRSKMPAMQIEQLMKQYVHKRLMEKYGVPRLSLFYM